MAAGGLQSCEVDRNAPDEPKKEVVQTVKCTPYEYNVGDSRGQSAKLFKEFYDNCNWNNCNYEDGYVYGFVCNDCGTDDKSKSWCVYVAKKGKKDGYYRYLMYIPSDKFENRI